ncbi:aminoglycoside phosphotransferase family protein [Streptomyces sp. NBC_01506]|uniref:aminoglycoside phosphotransferase family protein n=1 Tax=Streptomyces sp. NBC_01506 TaxID=2903887 RepID=UPI00386A5CA6
MRDQLHQRAVHDLVRPVLPSVAETDIRPVDEGGEHSTWWIGGSHVLRLALDPDTSARQRREVALRDLLRPRLAAVPTSVASGEWAPGLAYTLDARLPGISAEVREVSAAGEGALAEMLTVLRGIPASRTGALGLREHAPRDIAPLRSAAVRAAERLTADGEFDSGLMARDRPTGAGPDQHRATPRVLLHNDLKGEHLLLDAAGGLSGVLDWTDAATGDPAEDIAGLAISIGAPAAVRVATGARYTAARAARALALCRYDTLLRLADRLYGGDDSPLPLLRAQLDRAWRRTPLDVRGESERAVHDVQSDVAVHRVAEALRERAEHREAE